MLNKKESVTGDRKGKQQHREDLSTVWYLTIGAANCVLHCIPHNIKSRSSERTNTDSPPPISTLFPPLAVAYTVVIILPLHLNSCYWCWHLAGTHGYNKGKRWQSRTHNIHSNSFPDVCSLFNEATLASLKIALVVTLPIALWRHTQLSTCQLKCDLFVIV